MTTIDTRRLVARAASIALIGMAAVPLYVRGATNGQGTTGPISGTVFNDYDQNGVKAPGEPFLAGVSVSATSPTGVAIGPVVTDSAGAYSFGSVPSGTYRVEFATPAGMFPAPVGAGNGSSVQFVATDGTANAAFASPADYCQANPRLAITCFAQSFDAAGVATNPALRTVPYSDSGIAPAGITTRLTMSDVGATYGLAYHRASKTLFQGAFFRRAVALGSGGLGAIYATKPAVVPELTPPTAPSLVGTVPDVGTDPRPNPIPVGYWDRDAPAFDSVHKIGLGDIDLSEDQKTLYVVNLANNSIYSFPVSSTGALGAVSAPVAVPVPSTCTAGQFHVFGLGIKLTSGFVGGVCAGPTDADLKGYVIPFDATGPVTSVAAPTLTFPLTYTHGITLGYFSGRPSNFMAWDTITGDTTSLVEQKNGSVVNLSAPQASISDLAFNDRGDLVIGVRDRFGDQTGWGLLSTDLTKLTEPFEGVSAGDLLLACGSPLVLESNGSCGGRAGGGVGNNQGPGGGEFFAGENLTTTHQETSLGALARVPGKGEVVATVFDPIDVWEQGLSKHGDTAGAVSGQTRITRAPANATNPRSATQSGQIGKANGLGDMEALCDEAPIEIGNRLWLDANNNGLQDGAELGIDGVAVDLFKDGAKVNTTAVVTANGGQYYFNSSNVAGGILPNMNYEVRIPNATGPSKQAPLKNFALTTKDVGTNGQDSADSDAMLTGTDAVIAVPAASIAVAGQNNHTFDAGFVDSYSLGNRVWLDDGTGGGVENNARQDGTEPGIDGVKVNLFAADAAGNPICATVLATTTTAGGGYYRFDGLSAGRYVVVVDKPGSPALANLTSSSGTSAPENSVDVDDNGNDVMLPAGNACAGGIASGVVILGPGSSEPLGEADKLTDVVDDGHSNLTVDFGFFPGYSLGNRVWLDNGTGGGVAGNGRQDGTEPGIPGVVLKLYPADVSGEPVCGTQLAMTTTDANGYYRFDGLVAGTYVVMVDRANSPSLADMASSPGAVTTESNADLDDNGKDSATACGGGIASSPVVIGPGPLEPVGETDKLADVVIDGRSNLTVDFGFVGIFRPAPTPNPTPNPTPTPTPTTVAPTTTPPTTVAGPAPTPGPTTVAPAAAPTTAAPVATVAQAPATPPEADVQADIAFTGANDIQLLALSLLMVGLGMILWGGVGGRKPTALPVRVPAQR
jgi:hypothetical protein